jgi:Spy/CpxP family protein refolding chaperone
MNHLTTGKVIAYLAVIFMAGGATGAVLTFQNVREKQVQAPSVEKACNRFQDRLTTKLSLTPAQVQKLQPVFDQTRSDLRTAHARAMSEGDLIIRRAHEQIAKELTPEQKTKLERHQEERREWLQRRLSKSGSAASKPADSNHSGKRKDAARPPASR